MGISLQCNLSRHGRIALGLLTVALLGLLLAVEGCTSAAQDIPKERYPGPPAPSDLPPAAAVGRLAPDFTLMDLEGNRVTLSDFRGKTVFINFWTQWCPPCRAEMPEIEAIYQEYKSKDVVVIGVDLLVSEILKGYDENDVLQFVQQGGYSWIFVLDTSGEVSANYKITAIPTSFFIDREGIIQAVNIGAMTKRAMEARLAEAMR